jgi:antitoxin ParD1/3/4
MKTTSIDLGDQQTEFIERQIAKGQFASASEAVRAGLRLLEEQELKIERLRLALEEGEASGAPEPFEMEQFLAQKRRVRS